MCMSEGVSVGSWERKKIATYKYVVLHVFVYSIIFLMTSSHECYLSNV